MTMDVSLDITGRTVLVVGDASAARRVLRCNPWHPGGVDEVPPLKPPLKN